MPTYSVDTALAQMASAAPHQNCDVLIIGAGLAGLSAALSLPKHLSIAVLAKQDLQACSSHYAQGGIAAVIDSEDSVADHVSDTLIAGDGLCDAAATTQILAQGANAIDWLLKHKVPFTTKHPQSDADLKPSPTLADLHLTQEGGHGCRRVAHADDATGKHIMQALQQQIAAAPNIKLYTYHEALSLLTDNHRCTGAIVVDTQTQKLVQFDSQAVVLASGGLGQLFTRATAPNVCMGDGIMMAWEAGCRLANLEFIQFHPTGLVYNDAQGSSNFLISEAVRGEGGLLRCPISHERFMPRYDKREELAPRDIVARAIANEIAHNGLGYVHLDISHKPAAFIREHFPDIYAHCLSLGIDITTDPIPVAPTAHYTCGGVLSTAKGQTDIKGLYAAGEVANTGLHGANRLASNSLLECVVMGRAIAHHLPSYLLDKDNWQAPQSLYKPLVIEPSRDAPVAPLAFNTTNNDTDQPPLSLTALKQLMSEHMGIRRSASGLNMALKQLSFWQQQLSAPIPNKAGVDSQDIVALLNSRRLQRLLQLASLLFGCALNRLESRGGHYRNDYPSLADIAAMSLVQGLQPPQLDCNALCLRNGTGSFGQLTPLYAQNIAGQAAEQNSVRPKATPLSADRCTAFIPKAV